MVPGELYFELDCSLDEAQLFYALVVFLWERKTNPVAKAGPELDDAFGGDAAAIISDLTRDLDDFGIECLFDESIGKLTIMDIDRAPNLSALAQLLIRLYPHKLPIAFRFARRDDPAKTFWTVVSAERTFETGDWDEVSAALAKRDPGGPEGKPPTLH